MDPIKSTLQVGTLLFDRNRNPSVRAQAYEPPRYAIKSSARYTCTWVREYRVLKAKEQSKGHGIHPTQCDGIDEEGGAYGWWSRTWLLREGGRRFAAREGRLAPRSPSAAAGGADEPRQRHWGKASRRGGIWRIWRNPISISQWRVGPLPLPALYGRPSTCLTLERRYSLPVAA